MTTRRFAVDDRAKVFGRMGPSKVEQFWSPIPDRPGEFRLIHKTRLSVDDSYQRDERKEKALAFARNWSWRACGVVVVSERDDGTMCVIEGQHRVCAAHKRDDIDMLPCMVFKGVSVAQEASDFITINTQRSGVGAHDKFKALLAAGDLLADEVVRLCRECGRDAMQDKGPFSVRPIGAVMRCAQKDMRAFREVMPVLCKVSEGQGIDNRLALGFFELERRLFASGGGFSNRRLRERAMSKPAGEYLDEIKRAQSFYKRGGDRVFASAILQIINKNLSKKYTVAGLD